MLQMEILNLLVAVAVTLSPVLLPTLYEPENTSDPPLPIVTRMMHDPSLDGGLSVIAVVDTVMLCSGELPQSGVYGDELIVPMANGVTCTPPVSACPVRLSDANEAVEPGKVITFPADWNMPETLMVPEKVSVPVENILVPVKVWLVPRPASTALAPG